MANSESQEPTTWRSLNAVLRWRAEHQSERTAFIYLAEGEREAARLTFGELDRRAQSLAAWLQERSLAEKRVVLLYRAGLDFISGFFGCLYAGAIAVPAYPPHPRRPDPRLQSMLHDCAPAAAFCAEADCEQLSRSFTGSGIEVVATDVLSVQADRFNERLVGLDSIAHLQYTSGSTGDPKGVMVSHGNLLRQSEYLRQICRYDTRSVHVSWQPFFHDMGLIGSLVQPMFCGATTVIMSPAAFLQSPIRWLRAISNYRANGTTAPNFAYDLCVTATTPEQRDGLDLSSWEAAWNGAEPIRAETLDRFCETFEPFGFRRSTHLPSYGMAETTLCTTASRLDRLPVVISIRRDSFERGLAETCEPADPTAIRLVSSGIVCEDVKVAIVEPDALRRQPDGTVGEIWVSSPSVAHGYWNRPEESERTFRAHIAGQDQTPYLRTGDLGFLWAGELYVTGRLKDMIIVRGRNVYPQDVELVAQRSHESIQLDACAAFPIEDGHQEEIAVAMEARRAGRRRINADEVFETVRAAIAEHFGVAVHWLGLVQPGRIPKTSSGKIMRRACRELQRSGELPLLAEWRAKEEAKRDQSASPAVTDLRERLLALAEEDRHQALVGHLQNQIARKLELRALPDPQKGFERMGLDSIGAVELVKRLHDELGGQVDLPTTLLFDQPNIDAVARYVTESLSGQVDHRSGASAQGDLLLDEPVAVVGLACRFPGAADAGEFWRLLEEGRDAIREVSRSRWDIDAYFDPDTGAVGKMNSRFGGFIDDIDGFDAAFFEISPREASSMDPQHRHLLEVSWLALEDSGIAPASIDGRPIGVFMGISTSDYEKILAGRGPELADAFMATGNAHSAAVGRLSFALGLQGPCVAVDTACSSSLVAVHQAVQSLRHGECEMALAGGVNAVLRPEVTSAFSRARLLSPDGRCKTFDAEADGYVRSEGCGIVVLKRLSDARRDGDRILALIRGSAVNQDGRSSGLTAPNGPSQTQVIANALGVAKVEPASVQYLECHGTATVLGDPIEVQAANAILSRGRRPDDPLVIGSVKSNLGHLEAAAGIAGLIKVVLALQHGSIPRSIHFRTPNPHIPWASMPVKVAAQGLPWVSTGVRARIAGVSSFGFAGTNAHVIVEEAPHEEVDASGEAAKRDSGPWLLAISARTQPALKQLVGRYAGWLRIEHGAELSDVCHTANTGRNHFEHRAVTVCESREAVQLKLAALARGEAAAGTALGVAQRERQPRVAFMFPGQGLQYAGMASELYERAPTFRECFDRCAAAYDEFVQQDGSPPLKEVTFDPGSAGLLTQTRYVQPALYALQVSLAALWRSWGVKPAALLGHSAGEYAAACVAGVFCVEDGLRLIVERARLMQTLPAGGTMLSVTAPAAKVEAALAGYASTHVSAYNGLNTVISGPIESLDTLAEQFSAQELYCSKLPASNAFHSPSVEPILDEFEAYARGISFAAPTAKLISTMTGKPLGQGEVPDAGYWRHQARRPVRFAQGVQALFEEVGCDVALELGPQAELTWLAQMSWRPEHKVLWASSLAKGRGAFEQMLASAGQLYANGVTLDFSGMETRRRGRRKLSLPSYPFQHEHFWAGPMGSGLPSEFRDCFYRLQWHASGAPSSAMAPRQSWLILADESELGAKLAAALRAHGQGPVTASRLQDGEPSAASVMGVLEAAQAQGPLDHVVLLASPTEGHDPGAEEVWKAQDRGVVRALVVAQALISTRGHAQLWLVTRGAQSVLDGEALDPTHSTMWGFGRTLAIEHPDRFGGLIDLPLEEDAAEQLAGALMCDDSEKQVALRSGQRWLPRLDRYTLPESQPVEVKANATYLITGGTGALGLALARHLAERGAGQIVLTSRSAANASVQEAIREIGAHDCRVEVIRADVSDPHEVAQLMERIDGISKDHPLRGIIHVAGAHAGALIIEQTPETIRKVLAAKVLGAWNLHRQTVERGSELDLFVLFSSGASILGSRGHANYTASNAYLDSMAHYRRSLGLTALCINWGPWAGHGVAPQMQGGRWEDIGIRLIEPATAMRAFDRMAGGRDTQVSMQPMDLSRWTELARSGRLPPILLRLVEPLLPRGGVMQDVAPEAAGPQSAARKFGDLVGRFARLGPQERGAALQAHLRERVGAVLGMPPEKVDVDSGFFDMGMNSIMAVELRASLEASLGRLHELQAAVVFNHPTVRRLSAHLARHLFAEEAQAQPQAQGLRAALPAEAQAIDAASLPQAIDAAAAEILGAQMPQLRQGDGREEAHMRNALAAIMALRAELHESQSRAHDPIAIVGLSCRYPGADGPEALWRLLEEGRDEIGEIPSSRWDASRFYDPDPDAPGKMYSRQGGFISQIEAFDAEFFGISPREARSMDPQQRILLEVSWEALESANLAPRTVRGARGGVFVGITSADYAQRLFGLGLEKLDAYAGTGNALCAAAGRLAFTLGWEGPALAIDTACSSSLVSLHEACTSLRRGECDIALAGGANLILDPAVSITLSKVRALSPDDRCKTFDAAANGYVRSEGCGMVVLKRLGDAQLHGDRILALIRGSAVNQDGRSSGLTVPNGLAQERVISRALTSAGVHAAEVQYLEVHGTGTPLGDPIEVQAANDVLSKGRDPRSPLLIGSVKTNIGHTEAAAGIASVIKVVLAMQHEKLPKSLHFKEPNPHIPWDHCNVKVVTELLPWSKSGTRRIAGVSSFGFVGTNAHVVLEEASARAAPAEAGEEQRPQRGVHLLALSARSEQALQELARRYVDWLGQREGMPLAELCHTANTGRDHFEHRAGLVFTDRCALEAQLGALERAEEIRGLARGRVAPRGERRIAFLFTGQGSQSVGMGRGLYRTEPVFREHFDRCAEEFARLRVDAPDLRRIVFEGAGEGLIDQTGYTQPALYALEAALSALWRAWGVEPYVVLGHSVGEYAAAYTAGVFGLEEGLRLIAERGRLMQGLPSGGAMAAVSASAERVEEALRDRLNVCIGAYNGADTVISGSRDEVDALVNSFKAQGVRCRSLVTSHAFHSARMEPILDEFRAFAASMSFRAPTVRMINNVTGTAVTADRILDAEYWTGHIRRPVQFARGIRALQDLGCDMMLELGPHPVLVGTGQACWSADETPLWVGSLRRGRPDEEQLLDAAGAMYACGAEIDFAAMDAPWSSARCKLDLPTYPFQRRRYWVEAPQAAAAPPETKIQECLYAVAWERSDASPRSAESVRPETWLLLADETGVAAAIRWQLEQTGRKCVCLTAGEHAAAPVHALAEKVAAASSDASAPLTHVVHLWSLDRAHAEDAERLWEAQAYGVESVLDLTRALIDRHWQGHLWLVTSGVQRVLDSDRVDATQSPVWGLGKSIGMEHPELWGGMVDLPREGGAPTADLLGALESDDADDQVALRDGRRWVARLVRQQPAGAPKPIAVDKDGAYLITGGLGGVGLEVAKRLAKRGVRHLVLNGRRAPSDAAREAIAKLEGSGCEVRVVLADVSKEADVARLLDEAHGANVPILRGIVHAAGVDALAPLKELDHDTLRKTLAAKVAGGFLLDKLAAQRGMELSMFVCTSSISSVWGSVQQAAYSAANAYLDALAEQRRAHGRTANTVNFGPWARVGMGTANEEGIAWLRSRGIRALEPEFALDGMETAVAAGLADTAVADIVWTKFLELVELQRQRPLFAKLGRAQSDEGEEMPVSVASALIAELSQATPARRVELLQKVVRAELARVLQRPEEELHGDVGFFDMGMDSLMAVEFRNALTKQLGRKLPATMVMDSPDVDSAVDYILKRVLGLEGAKTVRQPPEHTASEPPDTTESEVDRLSASEVGSALESELKGILGA